MNKRINNKTQNIVTRILGLVVPDEEAVKRIVERYDKYSF